MLRNNSGFQMTAHQKVCHSFHRTIKETWSLYQTVSKEPISKTKLIGLYFLDASVALSGVATEPSTGEVATPKSTDMSKSSIP